jgi:cell fate (sporulation/competence/biofilm development) regulator YlbF (YheA/YmcA/DUF963 family)
MAILLEPTTVDEKARELCQFIVDQPDFSEARRQIEVFLEDAEAQAVYRAWQEKAHEIHRMGHEGLQPNDADLQEVDRLRQAVAGHGVASSFAQAEDQMNGIFGSVTKLLQQTLQLGRVPSVEEMNTNSGCCGGGGGGGCGCN